MATQADLLSGLAARDIALGTHEATYADWLREAREKVYLRAKERGRVTSDDVHELTPLPSWVHHNVMGAVFRDKRLRAIGFTHTKRPSGHARTIRVYEAAH